METGQALDYQPGSLVPAEKKRRDRLIRLAHRHSDWVVGFEDEVCWSRLAQPRFSAWAPDDDPKRLQQHRPDPNDKEPKALACYGLLRTDTKAMLLRFVEDRPVSSVTTQFLAWCAECLTREGKRVLVLVCRLPSRSPWLNPIEPKWVHGKRQISEADRKLSGNELKQRVCDYYGCELLDQLAKQAA